MRQFFSDTVAADTIPLKLVVYLGLLAAVLILAGPGLAYGNSCSGRCAN